MFPARYYPGRFFARRYWPAGSGTAGTTTATVLLLALAHWTEIALLMACPPPPDLRLTDDRAVDLVLDYRPTQPVALVYLDTVPLTLNADDQIDVLLSE